MTITRPRLEDAACRGREDLYLGTDCSSPQRQEMRAICAGCQDRPECLAYAVKHERFGFWAGYTARELAKLRREFEIAFEPLTNSLWARDTYNYTGEGTADEHAAQADAP